VLRVQKRMWPHGSRSWHAGGARGGTGSGGATWGKQERASVGSGRRREGWEGRVELQGAGGGADRVPAMASSGEGRLGQTAGRRGTAGRRQRGSGKAVALCGGGTWLGPEQRRGSGGAAHGRQSGSGTAQRRNRGGREVDEEGLKSNIPKTQGLHCNIQ
jgi:hypothetical protein